MIPYRTNKIAAVRATAVFLLVSTLCVRAEHSYETWRTTFNETQQAGQVGTATVTDGRGNVFITGYAAVQSAAKTFYTAKYDGLDGHVVWERTYTTGNGDCVANAIAIDSDGNVIVTGRESDANHTADFHTIKYNGLTGVPIWQKSYAGPQGGLDEALKVIVDGANNVIVTGKSSGSQFDFFTIKYSAANGTPLWNALLGGIRYNGAANKDDVPADLAVDSANNVIVTGKSYLASAKSVVYTAKYAAATGALLWGGTARTVSTDGDAEGVGLAVDRFDNVVMLGIGRNANNTRFFYTTEYEKTNGNTIFIKTHQSLGDDFNGGAADVAVDSAGNVIVTGTTVDNTNFSKNSYYTAKYAAATATVPGALLWETFSGSRDGTDRAKRVVVDGAGNVVVTGFSNDKTNHSADYYTVKYSGETGALLWEQLYDGVGNDDLPADLAVDDGGNVVVIGTAKLPFQNIGIRYDRIVTIKYNRLLLTTGEDAPVTAGVADAAKILAISTPAIGDNGAIAANVTVGAGKKKVDAILVQGSEGGSKLVAVQGGAAPGVTGGTYKSFYEPLISDKATGSDRVAFVAKMAGVPGNKSTGVWVSAVNGDLTLALQQGVAITATGLNGELLKSVNSLSWRRGQLVALITVSGSGVKGPNSTVLLGYNVTTGGAKLLRTGDKLTVNGTEAAIKTISVLSPAAGSAGQGRSQSNLSVVAKVTLDDKRTALVSVNTGGAVVVKSFLASDQALNVTDNPLYKGFGLPMVGSSGSNFAALGMLTTGKSVNSGNDTALLFSTNGTSFAPFAREGDTAPDAGEAKYQSFFDPLVNSLGDVAFVGTLAGKAVTSKNRTALWWGNPSTPLEIVARTGAAATETSGATGAAVYTSINSTALPGGVKAGPIFLATLAGEDVNKGNNLGLWAVDTTGAIRRLLRTGDILKTDEIVDDEQVSKTVAGMALLQSLPGAFGATRSFNETGAVAVLVNFTDKTQALIHVGIP
ncbi:MAG: Fibronectin, type domain protein [Chthoniobacteraceae bacterium]|nr:Fibronectin, type domain protein [Chthoniobacteraceae bacterium]